MSHSNANEEGIFRKKALDTLNEPISTDTKINVTSPSLYVLIGTLFVIIIAIFVWGIFGTISDKESVSGMMFPSNGINDVALPNSGTVRSVFVQDGEVVEKGQSLAMVSVEDAYSMISAPIAGTLLNITSENERFEAFEPIATIISASGEAANTLVAYVPFDISVKLKPGMAVEVTPKKLSREKDGYIRGRLISVGQYPVTKEESTRKIKSETFAQNLFPEVESAYEITMELNTQEDGSLDWSFQPEGPVSLGTGTLCDIQIITKRRSVHEYLFESVRSRSRKIQTAFK